MEHCLSLLKECLQILDASYYKDAIALVGEIPDIPSE